MTSMMTNSVTGCHTQRTGAASLILAPFASSTFATARWPFMEAMKSGVQPPCVIEIAGFYRQSRLL